MATESDGAWGDAAQVAGIASLSLGMGAQLNGISCGSAGNCVAVGSYNANGGAQVAFLTEESNGIWGTAHVLPGGAGVIANRNTVSCPSAGNCAAAGFAGAAPAIIEERNGTWGNPLAVPGLDSLSPPPAGNVALNSMSCAAAGECSAGGTYLDAGGVRHPFIVSETGGVWGDAAAPPGLASLDGGLTATILGLSCAGADACAAYGTYDSGNGYLPWTADESGGTWGTAAPLSALAGSTRMLGRSLSCATPGNCGLTGTYIDSTGYHGFLANEVGGTWQAAQDVPGLSGITSVADVISCAAPGDCAAAGSYLNPAGRYQEFVIDEANGHWDANVTAVPGTLAAVPQITAMSCTAPGYCSGTGNFARGLSLVGEATAATVVLSPTSVTPTYGDEQAAPVSVAVSSTAGGTPAGTVTVTATVNTTITTTLCVITLSAGAGSCAPAARALAGGSYQLAATYNGDTTYTTAATTPVTVTVAPDPTATGLTLSAASVPYGHESAILFSAVVTPRFAAPAPPGSVRVQVGKVVVCVVTLSAGRGSCRTTDTRFRAGLLHVTADYQGNIPNYAPSVSGSHPLTVGKAGSATTLALAKASVTYGHENAEKLTVRVAPQYHGTPTGKVTIKAGTRILCVITLRTGGGSCTLTPRQLPRGSYRLSSSYPGDVNFRGSVSAAKSLRIT